MSTDVAVRRDCGMGGEVSTQGPGLILTDTECYTCAGCGGDVPFMDADWLPEPPPYGKKNDEDPAPFCCQQCYENARRQKAGGGEVMFNTLKEKCDAMLTRAYQRGWEDGYLDRTNSNIYLGREAEAYRQGYTDGIAACRDARKVQRDN